MQPTPKKLQTPPKLQPDSNHALYQNLKDRLHQILHSLLQQKQVWQNRQNKRSQLIRKQLTSRQHAFSQLAAQNAQLKSQLYMARRHLQRVLPDLQAMGRENEVLQRSSIRTQNIITYLQTKNKQLNYGLIQAKRAIVRLKENKSKAYNSHLPEYNFDKIDYRSIFDYTGVLDEISIEELRKSKSSPKFQAITTASSCQPKPVKTQRSDTQSRQTSIKQVLRKQMQTFDEKAQGKQEKAIKGSLKKIGTLGYLSHAEHKRNLKQMKSAKRFSMDRETQIGQKQRVETKSRVPNKGENGQNAENGRKAQNGRKRK